MAAACAPTDSSSKLSRRVREKETTIKICDELSILTKEKRIVGNDDQVYKKDVHIWETLPRGRAEFIAQCRIETSPGTFEILEFPLGTLVGCRKFGYPEDNYGKRDQITSVIATEKANGECAHICAFVYEKLRVWVVGSKNVNVVFREGHSEDLNNFIGSQRHSVALKIAQLFADQTLPSMNDQQRSLFFSHLSDNKLTANAEAIFVDSQHLVDYNEVNQFRFFALSADTPSSDGLCVPPIEAMKFFEKCGLKTVEYTSDQIVYDSHNFCDLIEAISRQQNSEGDVIYGLDASGKVVCMWKQKAYPYVMERIVREAIKKGMVGDELFNYVQKRLSDQPAELRKYFENWEKERFPFLIKFAAWLQETSKMSGSDISFNDKWSISCKWLTLQKKCKSVADSQLDEIAASYKNQKLSGNAAIQAIMLVGPPGSGKSTFARTLVTALIKIGKKAAWVNQDEAGSPKQFVASIKKATESGIEYIVLDKSNMEENNRKTYVDAGLSVLVTLIFQHPEGDDALQKMCVSRIMGRGDGHRTLTPQGIKSQMKKDDTTSAEEKITGILSSFLERANLPDDSTCIQIDATLPSDELFKFGWEQIRLASSIKLPMVDELPLAECFRVSKRYEEFIAANPGKKQMYCCIKLKSPNSSLLDIVPDEAKRGMKIQNSFHVTIKFFGGLIDPVTFVHVVERLGTEQQLHLTDIAWNDKGVAIAVEKTFLCDNVIPHFTIGNSKGTPPVYSNELLQKPEGTDGVTRMKIDVSVVGEFAMM